MKKFKIPGLNSTTILVGQGQSGLFPTWSRQEGRLAMFLSSSPMSSNSILKPVLDWSSSTPSAWLMMKFLDTSYQSSRINEHKLECQVKSRQVLCSGGRTALLLLWQPSYIISIAPIWMSSNSILPSPANSPVPLPLLPLVKHRTSLLVDLKSCEFTSKESISS